MKWDKIQRVLSIYTKLMKGGMIYKNQEAQNYGVNERSVQRDIDDIRNFLDINVDSSGEQNTVLYDHIKKGYRMEQTYHQKFSNGEILAICKILLSSRAFTKKEMETILCKLIASAVPKQNQKLISNLIGNEMFHYIPPKHQKVFIDMMWEIGQAIRSCNYIEITYQKMAQKEPVIRKLKPVAILFSEYYFYLTAFIDDKEVKEQFNVIEDSFPTIYRIDRIQKVKISKEKFHIPYSSRFEEGEFRKRIQFMYGGRLQRVKFQYFGPNVEAILDRLPTAEILHETEGVYTIQAEVFGKGIDMWLRSQGNYVKLLTDENT